MRSVPEWHGKTDDSRIPASVRDRVCRRYKDTCINCLRTVGGKLRAELGHITALANGGAHREANLRLVCHECHKTKTAFDKKIKAKNDRVRKIHLGIKKPRTMTRWRKFDGTIVNAPKER